MGRISVLALPVLGLLAVLTIYLISPAGSPQQDNVVGPGSGGGEQAITEGLQSDGLVEPRPGDQRSPELAPLPPPPQSTIRGRVEDPAGTPVAGARVLANGNILVETTGDGEFELLHLAPGEYRLQAMMESMGSQPAPPIRVGLEDVDGIVLTLGEGRFIGGVVWDSQGNPLPEASIQAKVIGFTSNEVEVRAEPGPGTVIETSSDGEGHFTIGPLPAGTAEVVVQRTGFAGFGRVYPTDAKDLEITLHGLPGVFGRVVDPVTGAPLAFDRIFALASRRDVDGPWVPMDDPSASLLGADSPGDGTFRIWPRTTRPVRLVAEVDGFAAAISDPLALNRSDVGPLTLRPEQGVELKGRVVDQVDSGIAGATVIVTPMGTSSRTSLPVHVATDERGSFLMVRRRDSTECTVRVQAEGFLEHRRTVILNELADRPLRIELTRAASLEGRVDAHAAAVVPELWVRLRRKDQSVAAAPNRRPTDRSFAYEAMPEGEYVVELFDMNPRKEREASPLCSQSLTLRSGTRSRVALEARGHGGLEGTLTIDGAPAPFQRISLDREGQEYLADCTTDQEGRFAFQWLTPGTYQLSASVTSGSYRAHRRQVEVSEGDPLGVALDLSKGLLHGRLLRESDGEPVKGADILLEGYIEGMEDTFEVARLVSDDEGFFRIPGLQAGPHLLTVESTLLTRVDRLPVDLATGIPTDLGDLALQEGGRLTVILSPGSGTEAQEVELTVAIERVQNNGLGEDHATEPRWGDQTMEQSRRGSGAVEFTGVPAGNYELIVQGPGSEILARRTIWVSAADPETVRVNLK